MRTRASIYSAVVTFLFCFVACHNDDEVIPDSPQEFGCGSNIIYVTASTDVMSSNKSLKTGTQFEVGDTISVFAWTGKPEEISAIAVDDALNTLSTSSDGNEVWTATPPMYWADASLRHYFLGVYPNQEVSDFKKMPFTLDESNQEKSDLLVATNLNGITPTSTPVPLAFSHVMSRIEVNLNFVNFPSTPDSVLVRMIAYKSAVVNLMSKTVTPCAAPDTILIPMAGTGGNPAMSFQSIMVPQDYVHTIEVIADGILYKYKHPSNFNLRSGKFTHINLSISKTSLLVKNVTIGEWEEETINASTDDLWESKSNRPISEGRLNGLFSVGESKQAYFSMGNLQYQPSSDIWRFANNQYDYMDVSISNLSGYTGWVDLFFWGCSGWYSGARLYLPTSTYKQNEEVYYIDGGIRDLVGDYANCDWAYYNAISNGGNKPGLWRTLTNEEWAYLLSGRENADSKVGQARVDGVNGLVILPDVFIMPDGVSFAPNNAETTFQTNEYNADAWAKMENAGAVFLPAAGEFVSGTDCCQVKGKYWSTTKGCSLSFYTNKIYPSESSHIVYGAAVRPVQVKQ
ncbi:MAG: fimbrillin family protein [Marinilabiliaceae bacterium]